MKKRISLLFPLLLVVIMVIGLLPTTVFAEEVDVSKLPTPNFYLTINNMPEDTDLSLNTFQAGDRIEYRFSVYNPSEYIILPTEVKLRWGDEEKTDNNNAGVWTNPENTINYSFLFKHVVTEEEAKAGCVFTEATMEYSYYIDDELVPGPTVTASHIMPVGEYAGLGGVHVKKVVTNKPANGACFVEDETVNFTTYVVNYTEHPVRGLKVMEDHLGTKRIIYTAPSGYSLAPGQTQVINSSVVVSHTDYLTSSLYSYSIVTWDDEEDYFEDSDTSITSNVVRVPTGNEDGSGADEGAFVSIFISPEAPPANGIYYVLGEEINLKFEIVNQSLKHLAKELAVDTTGGNWSLGNDTQELLNAQILWSSTYASHTVDWHDILMGEVKVQAYVDAWDAETDEYCGSFSNVLALPVYGSISDWPDWKDQSIGLTQKLETAPANGKYFVAGETIKITVTTHEQIYGEFETFKNYNYSTLHTAKGSELIYLDDLALVLGDGKNERSQTFSYMVTLEDAKEGWIRSDIDGWAEYDVVSRKYTVLGRPEYDTEHDKFYYIGEPLVVPCGFPELTSITVTAQPTQKNYVAGEDFNPAGMVVKAYYTNGISKTITDYIVADGTNLTAGKTSVTISYTENGITKTTTVPITVQTSLTGITITKAPDKTKYRLKDIFTATGMQVTAHYSDGSSKPVTSWWINDHSTPLTKDRTSVTVNYRENDVTKTATQPIEVIYLTSIAVTKAPDKINYYIGDDFDPTGMEVTATFSDGSTMPLPIFAMSGYENLQYGDKVVIISYLDGGKDGIEKSCQQQINVTGYPEVKSIEITGVMLPVAGASMSTSFNITGGDKDYVNASSLVGAWFYSDTAPTSVLEALEGEEADDYYEKFIGGKYYTFVPAMETIEKVMPGDDFTATVNGNNAMTFAKDTTTAYVYQMYVAYTFYCPETAPTNHSISVTDGTPGKTSAAAGESITITANAPAGKQFSHWEVLSGDVTLANANNASTTFTMKNANVSIKAHFVNSISNITLNVPSPTAGATAESCKPATATTGTSIPAGYGNYTWYSSDGTALAAGETFTAGTKYTLKVAVYRETNYAFGSPLTVTINEKSGTIERNYANYAICTFDFTVHADSTSPVVYMITVDNGSSSAYVAEENTSITITANAPESGKVFDKWVVVSGGAVLDDETAATARFTMPANAVVIRATYKNALVVEAPTMLEGSNGVFTKGSTTGLFFRSSSDFKKFVRVEIDGSTITETGNYTKASGSTIITLLPEYLETLAAGSHTIAIVSENGTANENFTIQEAFTIQETETTPGGDKDKQYNITVINGKATIGAGTIVTESEAGVTITITADASASGKVFDKWIIKSDTQPVLAKATDATTTFTMPEGAVTVKATYKNAPVTPGDDPTQPGEQNPETGAPVDPNVPQTGDNSHMFLWITLLFVSGAGIAATTILGKKKRYNR